MLSLARNAAPNACRLMRHSACARTFATVVPATSSPQTAAKTPSARKGKIPVREDHGLYAFFRQKPNATDLRGEDKYLTLETPEMQEQLSGRDWRASELRLKSFRDLHTLWYVLLRERNLLATQAAEARRSSVDPENRVSRRKLYCVRISMARIKAVLNERRLAYEGAVELLENEQELEEDEKVLEYLERAKEAEIESLKAAPKSSPSEPSQQAAPSATEEPQETATSEPIPVAEHSQVVHETVKA